jgi:hypothetical protein
MSCQQILQRWKFLLRFLVWALNCHHTDSPGRKASRVSRGIIAGVECALPGEVWAPSPSLGTLLRDTLLPSSSFPATWDFKPVAPPCAQQAVKPFPPSPAELVWTCLRWHHPKPGHMPGFVVPLPPSPHRIPSRILPLLSAAVPHNPHLRTSGDQRNPLKQTPKRSCHLHLWGWSHSPNSLSHPDFSWSKPPGANSVLPGIPATA